ncbi:MAG: hypothetical protein V5A72_02720 [Candidatus Nanohaloarchaea archaeon]
MEDNYLGVIVEPWELEDAHANYSDIAMDYLRGLNRKCLLVESPSRYAEGEFDLVSYDEFEDYIGDRPVFLTGSPENVADVARDIDQDVVLDENILPKTGVQRPSTFQRLKEEMASLIPVYESDRQHVEVTTSEDVLREMGLEDVGVMPLHSLE